MDYSAMLVVVLAEARKGLDEGGIPIGAAIFDARGGLIGAGHNRRVQNGDLPCTRNWRLPKHRTLAPLSEPHHGDHACSCWYCSGLVRQFGFGTLVVGESRNFQGGVDWLRSVGVKVVDLDSTECVTMLAQYIAAHPEVWNEDIGEE